MKNITHKQEISSGERFAFGENWAKYLEILSEERIQRAVDSLRSMLGVWNMEGKSFLDVGSGSGLFSLAAKRLGAKVLSFDYDPQSVACTRELKRIFFEGAEDWRIETGSVLDEKYLDGLGSFDVVYSWGVLHHTGNMWAALEGINRNVAKDGMLFIALYNDQGRSSRLWHTIKQTYVGLPKYLRWTILIPCYIRLWGPTMTRDLLSVRPLKTWNTYKNARGMSPHRDVVDWVGGFPFEVATPEQIFDFYKTRGYRLLKLKTCGGGHGCNEFVFQRID